ncbi:tetratricopeptide repeat protein [Thalassobaculum litoreum]|uniref:Tetratricopeptide repeat-containing protein n=1 Tax=Thalassobaculum litoreum DSM 18839 TaxID=1123362 RepID=A0A8G2BNI2_9PROT|nr:tetratricopeptide repeat protein [Thalassobaculum litoreum]SDG56102.1 Tetratricopeptide repeat-containing protein [Thalassobaculum litoreum DSM 18839]
MNRASLRMLQEGIQCQRAGFPGRAARLYRRIPPDDQHYADALNLLGMLSYEEGRADEATELLQRSIRAKPDAATAWGNLGGVAHHLGRRPAAMACHRRSIILAPEQVDSVIGLSRLASETTRIALLRWAVTVSPLDETANQEIGTELAEGGDLPAAIGGFRRVLAAHPTASAALFSLGNALRDLKRPGEAERLYRRTLCLLPGSGNVQNNLGLLAFVRADWATAEAWFSAASRGDPRLAAAWSNRARTLQKLGRESDAIRPYKRALLTDPTDIAVCCELAGLLEAKDWARRAMALDPVSPQPYSRMALLATKNEGRAGVLDWLHRGAVVRPDDPDAWYNIGVELGRAGDPQGAVTYGTYATRVSDTHARAQLNTALALLALERFQEGWHAHTRRLETSEGAGLRRFFDIPEWDGDPIAGRHLLLWGEQGIGDEVQFLTLAPHLRRLGARLTIITEERLRPIVRRSLPDAAVPDVGPPTGRTEDHHGADLHLALGDLPDRLHLFCGGEAIPEPWIVPDADRAAALRSSLQARHPGKRLVGITWRSIAPKTGGRRTIAPALWRDVLAVPGAAVVSLQYGAGPEDIAAFGAEAGLPIDGSHGVDPVQDLDGLAALVAAMDLVVCPANNTVHFAGALAKPCWTLVPTRPDWRWGLGRSDSLWYPRTIVYRQETDDDWSPVMARVAADLASWIAQGAP